MASEADLCTCTQWLDGSLNLASRTETAIPISFTEAPFSTCTANDKRDESKGKVAYVYAACAFRGDSGRMRAP